jgi:hypothetical protein
MEYLEQRRNMIMAYKSYLQNYHLQDPTIQEMITIQELLPLLTTNQTKKLVQLHL